MVNSKSQSIDLEQFGQEQPLKVTGNLSANSVYYNSNQNSAYEPFTCFLQGSLKVHWYSFNIPISYTNQEGNLDYQLPFNFNRFMLDALGMAPVIVEAFDSVNVVWYTIDVEYGHAAISFASTIPFNLRKYNKDSPLRDANGRWNLPGSEILSKGS